MTANCPHCDRLAHSPEAAKGEETRCSVCGLVFRAEAPRIIAIQDENPPAVRVRVSILQPTLPPPSFPA
jgi:hypothetical protein